MIDVMDNHVTCCDVGNQVIRRKKNLVIRAKKEKVVETTLSPIEDDIMVSDYSLILRKNVNDPQLTKEEVVEQIEYQKDLLIKNRNQYTEQDYTFKLQTIDKLLSKKKQELTFNELDEMSNKRVKIDKIVLEKKIPIEQFKKKIDLTGEHDSNDPNINVVVNGRKYFEKMTYTVVPKHLERIDPKKNRNFGNKPMPPDLLKMINFSTS
jgi:hypothetical protein